jgi:F-type H+-transporting ATPase subunit gamma
VETLQSLQGKIESTEDLHSVVRTMKSLAAVTIRQFEEAAAAVEEYARTVEMGLRIALREGPDTRLRARAADGRRVGAMVFGTDQGMCGAINETVVNQVGDALRDFDGDLHRLVAVGERAAGRLAEEGNPPDAVLEAPGSVSGVGRVVQELLFDLEKWEAEAAVDHVFLFYNRSLGGASYQSQAVHLLPLDRDWLDRLRRRPWEGQCLPMVSGPPGETFSALVREYLFATLFRALADALAAENASRLAAMQGAEGKVAERLDDLRREYHRHRQQAITEELLDIAAGFEALRESG